MKARAVEGIDPAAPLDANARLIVAVRLAELQDLAGPALAPEAADAQHDLRIAAKRLRYVLELFAGCLGAEGDRARGAAKALQRVLGDLRDCDAMLQRAAGIGSLEMLMRTRRDLHFEHFRELWRAQDQSGVWSALQASLR